MYPVKTIMIVQKGTLSFQKGTFFTLFNLNFVSKKNFFFQKRTFSFGLPIISTEEPIFVSLELFEITMDRFYHANGKNCMFKYLYKILWCLVFLVLIILSAPVSGSINSFNDTTVERLMNHFLFREACNDINRKLKATSEKEIDRQLYYYNKLSLAELRLRNIDSALAMAKISYSLIPVSNDSVLIADAWRILSYSHNNAGDLDSALFYTQLMLGYAERKGDVQQMRNALVSMATIMNQNRQYLQALK